MPLRHSTETALILLLTAVVMVTGVLVSTLPSIPAGGFPWMLLFVSAVAYPVMLTPLFRARRADTPFRWMHWMPAAILLLWLSCELVVLYVPSASFVHRILVTAWMLPLVILAVLALVAYCLRVIRRRALRVAVLLAMLTPYVVLGVYSSRGVHWEGAVASMLWKGDWWQVFGSGAAVPSLQWASGGTKKDGKQLAASADSSEERWREKMRVAERRSSREAMYKDEEKAMGQSSAVPSKKSSSSSAMLRQASSAPAALPASGGPLEVVALAMVALYCGVLHDRVRRRIG
ncbi:hypothetical protein FJZ27_03965 [Candidatus Peribacteria bacterium]|nr:hypothetical protein [Candidatus Peribacteria bacterium]